MMETNSVCRTQINSQEIGKWLSNMNFDPEGILLMLDRQAIMRHKLVRRENGILTVMLTQCNVHAQFKASWEPRNTISKSHHHLEGRVDFQAVGNNDKRERVVKASRDITINSKKVIFQVHRMSKDNKTEVLKKAENDLVAVTEQYVARLIKELAGTDLWKLRRAYSPGVQEYVEAATLCGFCKTGTLLNLDDMNDNFLSLGDASMEPFQINVLDYLLGLADLTGELMRMAMGRISDGEIDFTQKICNFVREIHRELTLIVPIMDDRNDMKSKMDVMLQSVIKIENACYSVHVRGSEYIHMLGSDDTCYSMLGVSDLE